MAGVLSIILHCQNLSTLELKRTRLGYDGILYILCSSLRRLTIHDIQSPKLSRMTHVSSFSSLKRVPLPNKTSCTDFFLEIDSISTLQYVKIQSALFLPLFAGEQSSGFEEWDYCPWTGLGPLQQFNARAVRNGTSSNLRRSFSLSDLTQPQTHLFWGQQYSHEYMWARHLMPFVEKPEIDFKELFSRMREEGRSCFLVCHSLLQTLKFWSHSLVLTLVSSRDVGG